MAEPHLSTYQPPTPVAFLSHATADISAIRWAHSLIEASGICCYLAENDRQPGVLLADKVLARIDQSDCLIALLTKAGHDSMYVHQEIGAALHARKPVLALLENAISPNTLAMLTGAEVVQFDSDNLAEASVALVAGLRGVSEQRKTMSAAPTVEVQPALQVKVATELNLTGGQVLFALLIVAAIVGMAYLATHPADVETGE